MPICGFVLYGIGVHLTVTAGFFQQVRGKILVQISQLEQCKCIWTKILLLREWEIFS